MAQASETIAPSVNLIDCHIYGKTHHYYATVFKFEHDGRVFKSIKEFDHGYIPQYVFFKLVYQYFAVRLHDSNRLGIANVPIYSMEPEGRRGVFIEFNFRLIELPDFRNLRQIEFEYIFQIGDDIIRDTGIATEANPEHYKFDDNFLNVCTPEDWEFTEADFEAEEEQAAEAAAWEAWYHGAGADAGADAGAGAGADAGADAGTDTWRA